MIRLNPHSTYLGDDVTIVATGSSMDSIQSLSEVLFLADDGSELARHPGLTRVPGSADSAVFKLRITLPTTVSRFAHVKNSTS